MRVFVAVGLGERVANELWQAIGPVRSGGYPIRWLGPDGIHLTLKFLGEVDSGRELQIANALDQAAGRSQPFTLKIHEFGGFPSLSFPRVVWAGFEMVDILGLLQRDIESRLKQLGFPAEHRPFKPHITLGRAKKGSNRNSFKGLGNAMSKISFTAASEIRAVELMLSELSSQGAQGAQGARYTALHSSALGAK